MIPHATTSRPRRAFSLIELLVVLLILSALIAIAIPVYQSTRDAARSAACLSNLRQLGIALNAYLNTTDGRLPTLNNRVALTDPGPALDTLFAPPGFPEITPDLHRCPADLDTLYAASGTSYFWNFTLDGQSIDTLFSIVGGEATSAVPVLSDKEGFHPNLDDRINILYADGHASNNLNFLEDLPPGSSPGSPPAVPTTD
ncbi:MAG: prepilin-type N-terminal cleavage/methylation domain-containing protein [Planctomycetota bacterium]